MALYKFRIIIIINIRFFFGPLMSKQYYVMFTRICIVMNNMLCSFALCFHCKWPQAENGNRLLLRQRFNNKVGYTLRSKSVRPILFNCMLSTASCCLKYMAYIIDCTKLINCTGMRFLILDTHNLTQAYDADRAIFSWHQCYSSFPLREYFLHFCLFFSHSFPSSMETLEGL